MFSIINAGAENELCVTGDMHAAQALNMLDNVPCSGTIHHFTAQIRLGRMHRDVERRQLLLIESLPIKFFQIGQCDKIAKEERVAIVVILDIERGTHTMCQPWLRRKTLRQSLNKTEHTLIGALTNKRCRLLTEQHAQILINSFANAHLMLRLLPIKPDDQLFVSSIETIIDKVTDQMTINCADKIPRLQTSAVRRTLGYNLTHPPIHLWHSSFPYNIT